MVIDNQDHLLVLALTSVVATAHGNSTNTKYFQPQLEFVVSRRFRLGVKATAQLRFEICLLCVIALREMWYVLSIGSSHIIGFQEFRPSRSI